MRIGAPDAIGYELKRARAGQADTGYALRALPSAIQHLKDTEKVGSS